MNTPDPVISTDVTLARLGWMFFGPFALGLTGLAILKSGSGWVTVLDLLFFIFAALILASKWYELRSGQGMDGVGRPATITAFPKFALLFGLGSVAAWVVLNAIGNHVIN